MGAVIDDVARHVSDDERRARLARRHGIAPAHRYADVESAAEAMVALHATEASTVHLSLAARVGDVTVKEVDRALYADRTVVKQLAMRRTLFGFPRPLLPAVWGSAAARVADQQRSQLAKDLARAGLDDDPDTWIERARQAVLDRLADGVELPVARLREELSQLSGTVRVGSATAKWGGDVPVAPRVLTLLGAEGLVVRATNAGHWRLNKPTWTATESWLGELPAPLPADEGYAALVRRWLWSFGPGTEADLAWWLGATKTAVRRALATVGAVPVGLDGDGPGWLLPDDLEPVEEPEPWAALLPVLDPTTMGWKGRDFYLEPGLVPHLFDSNGNGGTTAWWCGRVVGCWVQDEGARVRVVPLGDPGPDAHTALDAEAERLTEWLDGVRVNNVYVSQQMKKARLP